jgi:hypothetical protein
VTDREFGPLDCWVVDLADFDAMPFEPVREILSLVDAEIIRVIDLMLIERLGDGRVVEIDAASIDPPNPLTALTALASFVNRRDPQTYVDRVRPGRCAAVLIVEHTWAQPLDEALFDAGCPLIDRTILSHL